MVFFTACAPGFFGPSYFETALVFATGQFCPKKGHTEGHKTKKTQDLTSSKVPGPNMRVTGQKSTSKDR